MKQVFHFFFLAIVLNLITACGSQPTDKITIATAANMQFVMQEMTKAFTEKYNIECDLIISSSGKLTAQILEGAPYDVFVAANMKYPEEVFKNGYAQEAPRVYGYGQLILWSMMDELSPSFENLSQEEVQHIALANTKTAPYGSAAEAALRHLKLWEPLQDKLVFGESIAQTNQFITSKAAEMGFTAISVVRSPQMRDQGQWIPIDTSFYPPIAQGVVLLKREGENEVDKKERIAKSRSLHDFLFSPEGQRILKDFGYLINE